MRTDFTTTALETLASLPPARGRQVSLEALAEEFEGSKPNPSIKGVYSAELPCGVEIGYRQEEDARTVVYIIPTLDDVITKEREWIRSLIDKD